MANARLLVALTAALLAWAAPAFAQTSQIVGDIRVRGPGVIQIQDQWIHLLDAATFERDEICRIGNNAYQCGLIGQAKLAELAAKTQYVCQVRDVSGDNRRYGSCLPYDFLTRAAIAGAEDLAAAWVRTGWAFARRGRSTALVGDEDAARAAKRGMWAGTTPEIDGEPSKELTGAAFAIDGATVRVNGAVLRLAGIDVPEAPQSCSMGPGRGSYFCGIVARGVLVDLTMGKKLFCRVERRPGDERNWATCGEANAAGTGVQAGVPSINEQMISAGWAVADRTVNAYLDLQIKADNDNVGMWQGTFTAPQQWRQGYR